MTYSNALYKQVIYGRDRISAYAGAAGSHYQSISDLTQHMNDPGGGGGGVEGTPIWNRRGCSSEILNLTPKGDHLGVAQAFCDP